MNENVEHGYYDATLILPTISISDLNRREVKNLAKTIAGRSNPYYGVTHDEVLNDKVNVISKSANQQDRFKRLVKKQYDKNVLYTQQLERAKSANLGDVKAMQDYITTGTNKVAPYIAPLLSIPAVSAISGTGVIAPALKHTFKVMTNPTTAKTTAGAMAATGLDATGVAYGATGMGNIAEKWIRGNFDLSDIPAFALNAMDAIPGAAAVNATIGAAQDAKRIRQAAKHINDAVKNISRTPESSTAIQPQVTMFENPVMTEGEIPVLGRVTNSEELRNFRSRQTNEVPLSGNDLDIDVDAFLRRAPEDMVNVEPSHNIEETSILNTERRMPDPIENNAPDPSIAYGNRRVTRSEIERLLRENGATQEDLDLVLGDFDTASNIGDGESFWWTSSGQRMNSLIPRQRTGFIDLGSNNRLYREDLERTLRSAGYEQDVIREALNLFNLADLGMDPSAFRHSRSGRLYDRLQRGISRNEIELQNGNIVSVDEASRIMRNLGYNEDAISRLINLSVREGFPVDIGHPSLNDLTDVGLRMHIDDLDDDTAIYSYASLLSKKKSLGTEYKTGRYKEQTRTFSQGDARSFKVFAERMSKIFGDDIDFTDLSEDNYVKIKNYLRSKGILSGDIEHMNWFQMADSLPKDGAGIILVTESDGTVRRIKYGERPQYSNMGRISAGKKALQMFEDVPRGYAVAETNTSIDSELLKLNGALRRYGFGPGQLSVELVPTHPDGNHAQFERLYMRDMLYYRDLLPDNEKVLLDKILEGKYGTEVRWIDLQGTGLLDLLRYEYLDLTNKLIERLGTPWKKIKAIDSRPEIQKAPMPSYEGDIDDDILELLRTGNHSPKITRQPTHIFKHFKGGIIGKTLDLIGCNNPILKPQKFLKGGKIGKFITGGPIKTYDINNPISLTLYWDDYMAKNNTPFTVVPEAPIDENELVKRQAWAESVGNDRAVSPKGAKGRYQIIPSTLRDYQTKTKDYGDIFDPKYNRRVRDWEFNRYKNSETVNMGNPTDSVKMGRRLAAYNYGLTNVNRTLTTLNKKGINTTTNFDWLNYFPKETRDYVNFVLRGKDTGAHRTQAAYENRKK